MARMSPFAAALLGCTALVAQPAFAGPSGASFDPATVAVAQAGAVTTVTQSTPRAVVDWASFDVLASETVAFQQPGGNAAILNRVHSPWASGIDGTITAPGRVIIQNSNGVVFGGSARVDVGSLVATSLNVDEQRFLDTGNLSLSGVGGAVRNAGTITAGEKGLVALVGGSVDNSGVITARLGSVALASGSAATIDFAGDGLVQIALTDPAAGALVANSGRISADGGSVLLAASTAADLIGRTINLDGLIEARGVGERGGQVALIGGSGEVRVGGAIDASGPSGGSVTVTGGTVTLAGAARIDASGEDAGGLVRVGGDYLGQGALPRADVTEVKAGAVIDASGAEGGTVIVWSDEKTTFDGTIRAEGGGFVETSSAGVLTVGDTATVKTAGGTWLLDPDVIQIIAGVGSSPSPGHANGSLGVSTISASTIIAALGANHVQLVADDLIEVLAPLIHNVPGDTLELITTGPDSEIHVYAPILLEDAALALRARGDILIGRQGTVETDFNQRGIIALGTGTAWIQTDAGGAIVQDAESAILAYNIGVIGGSIDLQSLDNFTLNIAGRSLNGTFTYRGTNATGVTHVGQVFDPFNNQSLTGATQQIRTLVGTQTVIATARAGQGTPESRDTVYTFAAGGTAFNEMVFSAMAYSPVTPGQVPPPAETDSSDYQVRSLRYALGGPAFTLTPESNNKPAGFALQATGGVAVSHRNAAYNAAAWGVEGFQGVGGGEQTEINHDPQKNISEELIVSLGGYTSSVNASLRLFFSHDSGLNFNEQARVQLFDTVVSNASITTFSQSFAGAAAPVTREYGLPNPALTWVGGAPPAYRPVDVFVDSQLDAYTLPVPTLGTTATQGSSVGVYDITVTGPTAQYVADRYAVNLTGSTLTVTPAPLTVVADSFVKVYGTADPTLTYNVTGLRNGDSRAAALTGNVARQPGQNVGLYGILQSTLAPTSNYVISSYTPGTLQITPVMLTVTAANDSRVYGDANPSWIAAGQSDHYTLSGFVGTDGTGADPVRLSSVNFATSATATSNVGPYGITPSSGVLAGAAAGNYMLQYVNGVLQVTPAILIATARDATRVYGDVNPPLSYAVTGWKNADAGSNTLTANLTTPAVVTSNVGDYAVNVASTALSGPASGNYTVVTASGLLRITPAPITVKADDKSRLFDEDNPPLTYTTTGWRNGDDLTTTMVTSLSTTAVRLSNVGDYPITVNSAALSGPAAGNYLITQLPGTLVIAPAPLIVVTADSFQRVYGEANPTFTFQVTGWRGGDEATNLVTADLTSAATILSNVGDYDIAVSNALIVGPSAGNYTLRSENGQLTIVPAPLVITADNLSRIYGDANPTLTAFAEGWRNGDQAFYTVTPTLTTTATVTTDVGIVPINLTGAALSGPNPDNYVLELRPGALGILPAPLTAQAGAYTKVYGQSDPGLGYALTGLKAGDTAAEVLSGAVTRAVGENVGAYAVGQGSVTLISNNYVLEFLNGSLTITPAPLTVNATNNGKVYGTADPTLAYTVSGLQFADTVAQALSGNVARDPGENVANYTIGQGGLALISTNYTLAFNSGVFAITPAPLTVTAGDYSKIYGDEDPAFAYTVEGLRNGDTAAIVIGGLTRETGENVGLYDIQQGTVELASINYTMTFVEGSLGITAAPLIVIANPEGKVVGEADPGLTYVVEGLKRGETVDDTFNGNVGRDPGEDVGVYPIREGTLELVSPNYTVTFVEAPFTIVPLPPRPFTPMPAASTDNPWLIDYVLRGRDPDTAGDAAWRVTRFENPYIPSEFVRGYSLGGVWVASADGASDWTEPDNDRTGQHADRSGAETLICSRLEGDVACAATDATSDAVAGSYQTGVVAAFMSGYLADYWTGRDQ